MGSVFKVLGFAHSPQPTGCPGEVCTPESKQAIQKTSTAQILVIFGFIAFIIFTAILFNDYFSVKPFDLLGIDSP